MLTIMSRIPTIAIVGRPNVGKSAIFNRMVGRRIAIVHDEPGVTRDRLAAPCEITRHACSLIDTGGIGATLNDNFTDIVAAEADLAMQTADLILFVLDSRDHLTPIDLSIASRLRRAQVPVIMVLNKADHDTQELNIGEFSALGFDTHVFISAAHGRGFTEFAKLLDDQLAVLGAPLQTESQTDSDNEAASNRPLRIALIGRPNAGKSSMVNAILNDKRTIVSEIAGTTRDAIDIPYSYSGQDYILIDTAGMRPRSRRDTSVEVFSAMRSEKAIRRSDICLLIIDIDQGVTQQDRRIAGMIAEEGKPCLVVANKFDLFHPNAPLKARRKEVQEHLRENLFFLNGIPFVAASAREGIGINDIFRQINAIRKAASHYPGTSRLNKILQEAIETNPPGIVQSTGKRLRLYYATAAVDPNYSLIPVPKYILFVNDKKLLTDSYAQYLRNAIRQQFPVPGIPIIFSPRSRIRNLN